MGGVDKLKLRKMCFKAFVLVIKVGVRIWVIIFVLLSLFNYGSTVFTWCVLMAKNCLGLVLALSIILWLTMIINLAIVWWLIQALLWYDL